MSSHIFVRNSRIYGALLFSFAQESGQSQRPLPKPPKKVPAGNHLPASRSPRARRRYKVASSSHARSQVAEEEEDAMDDEEDSVADSDTRYVWPCHEFLTLCYFILFASPQYNCKR